MEQTSEDELTTQCFNSDNLPLHEAAENVLFVDSDMEIHLYNLLNEFRDALPDSVAEDIQSLIGAGEYGVSFEELCNYLHEGELTISQEAYEKIESLGITMGIAPSYWSSLKVS